MKKKANSALLILIFAFVVISKPLLAQALTSAETESTNFYTIAQIPEKYSLEKIRLQLINQDLKKFSDYEHVKKRLDILKNNYTKLRKLSDELDFASESPETIFEFLRIWRDLQKEILEWSNDISPRIDSFIVHKNQLQKSLALWQLTDSLAQQESIPIDLQEKVKNLITELESAIQNTTEESNKWLAYQNRLVDEKIKTELYTKRIESFFISGKWEVFHKNSVPIWQIFDDSSSTQKSRNILEIYSRENVLDDNETASDLLLSLVLLILILSFVYALIKYSNKLIPNEAGLENAYSIFRFPISTVLLVFLFILYNEYINSAEIVSNLIRILELLPLIIIFRQFLNSDLRKYFYVFSFIVFLQQIKIALGSGTLTERIFLLIIILLLLTIVSFILIKKKNIFPSQFYLTLLKTVTGLLIIAFTANIFGYTLLSKTILNGILNSVFGIINVYLVLLIIKALLLILMKTKFARKSNIVRIYQNSLAKKIKTITKIAFIYFSMKISLKSFGLLILTSNYLEDLISNVITVGSFSFKLETILIFFLSIWIAILISRSVKILLEEDILSRIELKRGVSQAVSAVSSYIIIGFGILFAVLSSGIDLTSFALLSGALGVGIGFGLQDIVRNFISGIILILERPIQVGDAVDVEDASGIVTKIGIRSSVIKTWDGSEVIVPNGNLILKKLTNWTLSEKQRRIVIEFKVAGNSDVGQVMNIAKQTALANNKILKSPEPVVYLKDFAAASKSFDVRCWTDDFDMWNQIRSDLKIELEKSLRENNITIV